MKKFTVISLALAVVMLFAGPAMATTMSVTGSYEATGWLFDNQDLDDDTTESGTNAWIGHDLRLETWVVLERGVLIGVLVVLGRVFHDSFADLPAQIEAGEIRIFSLQHINNSQAL